MSQSYEDKWKKHTESMTVDTIINSCHNSAVFQKELSDYLNLWLNGHGKCFFDLNSDILKK